MDTPNKKYYRFVYTIQRDDKVQAVCRNHQEVTRIRALLINGVCLETYGKPFNELDENTQYAEFNLWKIGGFPILKLEDFVKEFFEEVQ